MDANSVKSSERASNVGRRSQGLDGKFNPSTLRGKLIDIHTLDQDEVNQIVANMGKGCAMANISKLSKSTMDSIKQVEFVDPKKGNAHATRLQVGRAIYEFTVNMIIPCGEAFVMAVKYNIDIASELDKVSKQKEALTNAISDKRLSLATVYRPDRGVFDARIEIAVGEQNAYLKQRFQTMFNTRQIIPATRTRSASKGATGEGTDGTPWTPTSTAKETWEESVEFTHYQTELQAYTEATRLTTLKSYMEQQDAWEKFESSRGTVEQEIRALEEQKSDSQALELMFQEMRNQMNAIVQKVKNAAATHTFICDKLRGQIVVNNENIFQPYYSDNLCGIFHILHREYSTATFELFCTFLMDTLSITATAEELATNPYIVAQRTDAKLKMWLDFKFDTFMTRDNLFTIANLKALQGDVRRDCMTKVLEKAHELEKTGGAVDEVLEYQDMPLYSTLVRMEKTITETSTFPSAQKSNNKHNPTPKQYEPDATEAAASASVTGDRGDKPYKGEVLRAANVRGPAGFPYLALRIPCPDCKERNDRQHTPRCYGVQCTVCGYYGHKTMECMHTPRPDYRKGGGAKHP